MIAAVMRVLESVDALTVPRFEVYNKVDQMTPTSAPRSNAATRAASASRPRPAKAAPRWSRRWPPPWRSTGSA